MSVESVKKPLENDGKEIDFFREKVVGRLNARQDHIADAVSGTEIATINKILLALEKSGILKEN